jgi:ComF family protein
MRYTERIGRTSRPDARCVFHNDFGILKSDVPLSETSRWRAVVRVLRSPIDSLSCALLPAYCALCGFPLPRLSSVPICDACWLECPLQSRPVCVCCGDALNVPAAPGAMCRPCRMAPPAFTRAVSFGLYQGRMREAIHVLKYDRLHPAARVLGRMLADAIAQLACEAPQAMLVVPVPLHRSKYAQRGFNQSRSLAFEALRFLHKSHPQWQLTLAPRALTRLRATDSQAGLTPRQRRLNVRGAFSVSDPAQVRNRHILVIDDILTTGATARAAAQVLVRAGAASVLVATLARAQRVAGFGRGLRYEDGEFSEPGKNNEPESGNSDTAMQATGFDSESSSLRDQASF